MRSERVYVLADSQVLQRNELKKKLDASVGRIALMFFWLGTRDPYPSTTVMPPEQAVTDDLPL